MEQENSAASTGQENTGTSAEQQKRKDAREWKTISQWTRRNVEYTPEQNQEKRKRATELRRQKRKNQTQEEKEESNRKRRKTKA